MTDADTVVRFKVMTVEVESEVERENKEKKKKRKKTRIDDAQLAQVIAAMWVTEGEDRCILGRLPYKYFLQQNQLDGRLAQVVDMLHYSTSKSKRRYSKGKQGAFVVQLLDKGSAEDHEFLDSIFSELESDAELDDDDNDGDVVNGANIEDGPIEIENGKALIQTSDSDEDR